MMVRIVLCLLDIVFHYNLHLPFPLDCFGQTFNYRLVCLEWERRRGYVNTCEIILTNSGLLLMRNLWWLQWKLTACHESEPTLDVGIWWWDWSESLCRGLLTFLFGYTQSAKDILAKIILPFLGASILLLVVGETISSTWQTYRVIQERSAYNSLKSFKERFVSFRLHSESVWCSREWASGFCVRCCYS